MPEDLSDCEPPDGSDVIDVLVSPSSVITELCDVSPCRSHWEFVEPQSFSFSKQRARCCTDTREEMRYEGSTVITPPLSRRRMTQLKDKTVSGKKFQCEGEGGRIGRIAGTRRC